MVTQAFTLKEVGTNKTDAGSSTSTTKLVMEDRIEYNDLTQMMLYDLARIELIRKALDTDNKGHGQNSKDHGISYFWLKRDNVGIMAAFKFKKPCQHYVIVANSHLYS
nr:DNAse I-like superfamily protein [Tanacetum cinerariifolium]